jgi:hypothetical protein
MSRLRPLAAAAALVASGLLPGAPVAASHAANGAWTPTLPATSGFDNLSAFPDGTAYATIGAIVGNMQDSVLPPGVPALGPDTRVGFFRSRDFGQTWQPAAPPPLPVGGGTYGLFVRFATPKIGYATYSGASDLSGVPGPLRHEACLKLTTTWRTADGGTTWQPICEPHLKDGRPVANAVSPLGVARNGRTLVLAGNEPTGPYLSDGQCHLPIAVLNFSNDGGTTWTRGALPRGYGHGWNVKVLDARTALVVAYRTTYDVPEDPCAGGSGGYDNAVFLTTDAGRTYRRVYECRKQPICTTAAFLSAKRIVVGKTDGSTAVTADGGRTWRDGAKLSDPANDAAAAAAGGDTKYTFWAQGFGFADATHGYASTRGAGTWRTEDGGRTWVQELSHECMSYPVGVGENASATADRSITGGPGTFSARSPSATPAPPCHPRQGNITVAPDVVAAAAGAFAVRQDGTVRLGR